MCRLFIKSAATFLLIVLVGFTRASSQTEQTGTAEIPWAQIRENAARFVDTELPRTVFPFDITASTGRARSPLVYAHYFPVWLLSLDNKSTDNDFWAQNYKSSLSTFSQNPKKYQKNGGFFRDRPISPKPYVFPYWRERNLAVDILRAERIGIDGFIIGLGQIGSGPFWEIGQKLCDVASHVAPGFRILMQPYLASLGDDVTADKLRQL